ncbi:uncharacterized protein L969DRAFT_94991 [Mixia osmundae IAM 14324]|uniref:uncharacterized protein n=1 Tax=Mixia osmundae (strain CBS 9802 / IAM 14324 / JCM 22182 / KY 12970) TaxID=764103 RepID=UPI0004A554EE|nr:uncharacterized protein L969DRAFT_94991 [Mixia osmundae IAM 14324]KEI38820.1 hypothetical protein L969DRAFT_94991 [Mixia osmundae IAM 14324]
MARRTASDVEALLKDDNKVKVAGVDADGVLRGKIMSKSKFLSCIRSDSQGFGFCGVIFGWDISDTVYTRELGISNSANGYRDLTARIDFDSYRRIPFENNIALFLVTFMDPEEGHLGKSLCACPRGLLQRITAQYRDELGYEALCGAEYEYFQSAQSVVDKGFSNLTVLTPGMHGYSMLRTSLNSEYFHDLYEESAAFGIEIEGHHTETGPGVYETALAYTNAERMADNAALFKLTAKTVGMKYGIIPSFMAKPHNGLPGCSGHVHFSLKSQDGKNVFAVDEPRLDAKWPDLKHVSRTMEHFIAGILQGLPDVMPCLVPTINGYKRLVENYWAPVNVSWGLESRLASIRIISPPLASASATRVEVRVPGADMNPYYTFSAILALGLYGIKNQLELDIPPITAGADVAKASKRLAKTLKEATDQMSSPESLARKTLGDDFVDHYAGTREHEWQVYSQTVTSWDLERYLELA